MVLRASPLPPAASSTYTSLSQALLERAETEVVRVRVFVQQGTLPKSQLEEAEARLADAQDQVTLAETLYGTVRVQDMTDAAAQAMVDAAARRLNRQTALVAGRRKLVDMGILAPSDFNADQQELESRGRVLDLAQNRRKLLDDLRQMAETEGKLERAAQAGNPLPLKNVMIRYDGNGLFGLGDLTAISAQFQKQFHHALPVSALGQTLLHQSLGLDHRNRVDVALNPDAPEGLWLRALLERIHVPYLAFRSAVAGAATAPHIHIGTGSTRLKLAAG